MTRAMRVWSGVVAAAWLVACQGEEVVDDPFGAGYEPPARDGGSSGAPGAPNGSSSGGSSSGAPNAPGTSSSGGSSSGELGASSSSGGGGGDDEVLPPGGTLGAGTHTWSYDVGGQARSALIYVPSAITQRKLPVVIALHGNGGSASSFTQASGLLAEADARGFVLIGVEGRQRVVQVGGQSVGPIPWDGYNTRVQNEDLQLLAMVLAQARATGSVEDARISLYGFSQGGFFAYRAAKSLGAELSCVAVLAAGNPGGLPEAFARPLFVSLLVGQNDSVGLGPARSAANELRAASVPHELVELPGLGHSLPPAPQRFAPLTKCLSERL